MLNITDEQEFRLTSGIQTKDNSFYHCNIEQI